MAKLHYLLINEASEYGYRYSAILPIIIYPVIWLMLRKKFLTKTSFLLKKMGAKIERITFAFDSLLITGFIINTISMNNAHISGRLSRFNDYFLLIIIGMFLLSNRSTRALLPLILIIILFISIVIYPSLYNFNLSII